MADYTDYNEGNGNKGIIVALVLLAAIIGGLIWIGANAPVASEGAVSLDPAGAVETAPAVDPTAPVAAD